MTDELRPEIVPLPSRGEEKLEAADWLAKLDRGGLTQEERAAFSRWLSEDPRNKLAIKRAADFWYGLDAPLSELSAQEISARGGEAPARAWSPGAGVFSHARVFAGAAAALVLCFVAVFYFSARPVTETEYYSTKIGETRELAFSDGSHVTLNTNTILEQEFSKRTRKIRLVSGEAIFDVAHDEKRPFLVYASDGVIRAVGTRFSVRVQSDAVKVTVSEGLVALRQRSPVSEKADSAPPEEAPAVMIGKGEAGEIEREKGAVKEEITDRDLTERMSWAQGQLVFYDQALSDVIGEVARYTTTEIQIDDPVLRSRKITGILQIGDVDRMLEGIEGSLGVTARRVSPDLVVLSAS